MPVKPYIGECVECKQSRPINNKKGVCVYCVREKNSKGKRKKKNIPPISNKRKQQNEQYLIDRKDFLENNPVCQVRGCNCEATEVHHKKGRENKLLLDQRYWMAICRKHHTQIDEDPKWARENGYTIKRF